MGVTQKERECAPGELRDSGAGRLRGTSWGQPSPPAGVLHCQQGETCAGNVGVPSISERSGLLTPNSQTASMQQNHLSHWVRAALNADPLHIQVGAQPPKQIDIFKHETWVQGSPVVMTLRFYCRGVQARSLAGELRSHMLQCGQYIKMDLNQNHVTLSVMGTPVTPYKLPGSFFLALVFFLWANVPQLPIL